MLKSGCISIFGFILSALLFTYSLLLLAEGAVGCNPGSSREELNQAGIIFLFLSILAGTATIYSIKASLVSIYFFLAAAVLSFLPNIGELRWVIVVVFVLLAILSYFSHRIKTKEKSDK